MVFNVEGFLAPVFTPFSETGHVDFHTIPIYMDHLHKHQINGILGGTTGEGMALSVAERKSVLEAWMTAAKPFGTKVIAQVGGAPMPDVIELAKHAEQVKAHGIMTLPELYYKPRSVDQLICYLKTVSEAAPTLPLIYYHFPMMTRVDVNMREFFLEASSKLPNLKGAKADLDVAEQITGLLGVDQKIFIANHHIATSVLMGQRSSIATVTNLFPDLVHDIVEAVKNNDVVKARSQQERLNRLVDAITTQGDFVPTMKAAMELVNGIRVGPTRQPLLTLNNKQLNCLKDILIRLDVPVQM